MSAGQDPEGGREPVGRESVGGIRHELAVFVAAMESKLTRNDHKLHWSRVSSGYLMERLREELGELTRAVRGGVMELPGAADAVMDEAVDVANFAMMVFDKARATKARGR